MPAGSDTSFRSGSFLETPQEAGAFDAIRELGLQKFGANIFLVSKCGPKIEAMTIEWLEAHGFWDRTGIARDHLYFCRTRPEKAPICERLEIDCFIDDRQDVLSYMTSVSTKILFGASGYSQKRYIPANDWPEVMSILLQAKAN